MLVPVLLAAVPSLTVQDSVREVWLPPPVGSLLAAKPNSTESSAVWNVATLAEPVRVSVPLLKLVDRPPGVPTVRVSPEMKPPITTVALANVELDPAVIDSPGVGGDRQPPPVNVTVPLAVRVGGVSLAVLVISVSPLTSWMVKLEM